MTGVKRTIIVMGALLLAPALAATVTYKNGRREVHDFGRGLFVVTDPLGGPAWKLMSYGTGGDARAFFVAGSRPGAS